LHSKSFSDQHIKRVAKFLHCFLVSHNDHVSLIGGRTRDFCTGALGRNRARVEVILGHPLTREPRVIISLASENSDLSANAEWIRELIDARDGIRTVNNMTNDDICDMIEHLCCS